MKLYHFYCSGPYQVPGVKVLDDGTEAPCMKDEMLEVFKGVYDCPVKGVQALLKFYHRHLAKGLLTKKELYRHLEMQQIDSKKCRRWERWFGSLKESQK